MAPRELPTSRLNSHNLRTPDALQVSAALTVGSDAFLTNDRAIARVVDLRVLVLSDLTG
jgi:predicted nucleic acid-binding protein